MPKLVGTVTETAADTFTQKSVQTGLLGQIERAIRIRGVQYQVTASFTNAAVAQAFSFGIWRQSKTAFPLVTDQSVFFTETWTTQVMTAVGQLVRPNHSGLWIPPLDVIVVEDPIYIGVQGQSTGVIHSVFFGIVYEVIELSEVERLALLAESLSSNA